MAGASSLHGRRSIDRRMRIAVVSGMVGLVFTARLDAVGC